LFLLRFVKAYLILCAALLAGLLVADALFPQARVYERIRDALLIGSPSPARKP